MPITELRSRNLGDIKENKRKQDGKDKRSEGKKEIERIKRQTEYARLQQKESDEKQMSTTKKRQEIEEEGMPTAPKRRKVIAPGRKREAVIEKGREAKRMQRELDESRGDTPGPLERVIDEVMQPYKDTDEDKKSE